MGGTVRESVSCLQPFGGGRSLGAGRDVVAPLRGLWQVPAGGADDEYRSVGAFRGYVGTEPTRHDAQRLLGGGLYRPDRRGDPERRDHALAHQ